MDRFHVGQKYTTDDVYPLYESISGKKMFCNENLLDTHKNFQKLLKSDVIFIFTLFIGISNFQSREIFMLTLCRSLFTKVKSTLC